ncbi:MAG: GW dipeptide domain-containing protein [Chloroflexota bacterium]
MNRRIVLPLAVVGIVLCFSIMALPVAHAGSSSLLQATEQVDPCNFKPAVPGTVLTTLPIVNEPNNIGRPLIKVFQGDVIEVLGKNKTGFWVLVKTNWGVVGWAPSPQVLVAPKLWGDPKMVPVVADELPAPEATAEATEAVTETVSTDCTAEGIVAVTSFALQIKPLSRSGDTGATVKGGDRLLVLALNPSGSWFKVQTDSGEVGWIVSSSVATAPGKLAKVPKDFGSVEATLTPKP